MDFSLAWNPMNGRQGAFHPTLTLWMRLTPPSTSGESQQPLVTPCVMAMEIVSTKR